MIKVAAVFSRKGLNISSTPDAVFSAQALESFIQQVGYENIKQILVNGQSNAPLYTVIYEE